MIAAKGFCGLRANRFKTWGDWFGDILPRKNNGSENHTEGGVSFWKKVDWISNLAKEKNIYSRLLEAAGVGLSIQAGLQEDLSQKGIFIPAHGKKEGKKYDEEKRYG